MMNKDEKRKFCISLLRDKAAELERLPKRSDFPDDKVCLIKQKLGPWPRALEEAGLKEPPLVSRIEKNRAKRERARKNRKNFMRESKSHTDGGNNEDSV